MQQSTHEKTRALANEILNDWQAIFNVLRHPERPLTNNEAERALRHLVILRQISHGTRLETGTAVALDLFGNLDRTTPRRSIGA